MKKQSKYGLISVVFFALAVVAMVATGNAHATGNKYDHDIDVHSTQTQEQGQQQGQEQTAEGGSAANNLDIDASENNRVENNSSNVVLVPNNNTEKCLRVFGFAFGRDGDSAAFGIPWRADQCDYGQAADDAFAAGERELGWYWNCHKKALYKPFLNRSKGVTRAEENKAAIAACHEHAVGEVGNGATIQRLKDELAFLQNERRIERQKCDEAKDRIVAGCYSDK